MEVRRRQKYVTARQKQKLIEFMTKHPELISCKVKQGFTHKDSQRLWQVIANECNSIHLGARKSWRQWKKTWQDMRSKTKKRQAEANGELLVSTARLTNAEQEALGLKDIESSEYRESTEFINLEDSSREVFNEEMSGSLSERDSPVEAKITKLRSRQKYVTSRQKQKLIELMKKHPELNSGKDKQGLSNKDLQILWQGIANECNSVQMGARKSWSQWKKTWQDMRSKMVKRRVAVNGELLVSTETLTNAEQEALGLRDIDHSEFQGSTEFINLENNSQEAFNEELSGSMSERDSLVEEKVFNSTSVKNKQLNNAKPSTKHKCYLNCDVIAVQEQRKIQMKEDYLNFKKDYLRQKLKLLKEQTEALKSIAKELST